MAGLLAAAIALALAVASAPASPRRAALVVDFGARYTGTVTGHEVVTNAGGSTVTDDWTVSFRFFCSWPGSFPDNGCQLEGDLFGSTTSGYSDSAGCAFPIELDQAKYAKRPISVSLSPVPGKFGRPRPGFFKTSAAPLPLQDPFYWTKDPADPKFYKCFGNGFFLDVGNKPVHTEAIVDFNGAKGGYGETNLDGVPNIPNATGHAHYHADLSVSVLQGWAHTWQWYLDQLTQQFPAWLQAQINSLTGSSANVSGVPAGSRYADLDASGNIVFHAKGGLRGLREPQADEKTVQLFTIHQRIGRVPTSLQIRLTAAGRVALASLSGGATVHVTSRLRPNSGPPTSKSYTFTLTPRPAGIGPSTTGTITSVSFAGSSANPSVVVHGTSLGALPKPDPAGHPSGQNGCPTSAGDNGYDYGTSLYLAVPAKNWSAGRYRPSLNETDCLDLVVTKFTPTEVDFHLGPFYTQNHAQFSLDDGDAVEVGVNGATKTVHVKYGATVSS
jgi:hypothetical protein